MAHKRVPLPDRFWTKVRKTESCWIWVGSKSRKGYGRIGTEKFASAKLAHRVSWEIHRGEIPTGALVLHHCDNPSCVRPDHLFLGSGADNNADMARKGRGTKSKRGLPYGVSLFARHPFRPYSSTVRYGGSTYHLGYFATCEEASAVAVAFKEKCYREGAPK